MDKLIRSIPKAELHIHIEGALEPELMFEIAGRNGIALPYASVEAVRKAYTFSSLQSFLDIYYQGTRVLVQERDFYALTWTYLQRAHRDGVVYAEIFFDPQTHTERGVSFETVIIGIHRAIQDAAHKLGVRAQLIMCFLRHLSADSALAVLQQAVPFKQWIVAVGLDSSELGHPPQKFAKVFETARREGFLTVAHAGEEGPPEYIWQALDLLKVSRIDHGVRCIEDRALLERLRQSQIPLTLCPLSNLKLHVVDDLRNHNLKKLLDFGLCVTVNSDDPAYFGGYIVDNFLAAQKALNLDRQDIYQLAANGFQAAFIANNRKQEYLAEVERFMADV